MRKLLLALALVLVLAIGIPSPGQAENFSVDLDWIRYSDPGLEVFSDFSSGTIEPNPWPHLVVPVTNGPVDSLWWEGTTVNSDPSAHAVLDTTNGVWRMSVPEANELNMQRVLASAFSGFSRTEPDEYAVEARFTNFANMLQEGVRYSFTTGGGRSFHIPGVLYPRVSGAWFSGIGPSGDHVDNLLSFVGRITSGDNSYYWQSDPIRIFGLDPSNTVVDMKVQVDNDGQAFHSYYRLNGAEEWIGISEHTLPEGLGHMYGLAEYGALPFAAAVTTFVHPASVPEPATMLLLGSGVVGLAGFRKRLRS